MGPTSRCRSPLDRPLVGNSLWTSRGIGWGRVGGEKLANVPEPGFDSQRELSASFRVNYDGRSRLREALPLIKRPSQVNETLRYLETARTRVRTRSSTEESTFRSRLDVAG